MTFTAAVVQAGSVVMDRDACVEKAADSSIGMRQE